MWAAYTPEQLPHAVRDPANLAALKRVFIDRKTPAARLRGHRGGRRPRAGVRRRRPVGSGWPSAPDRSIAGAAVAARHAGDRGPDRRWSSACARLTTGQNLAEGKPFRTSSTWSGWAACQADGSCSDVIFHTDEQMNPWVEYDLGAPKKIHQGRDQEPGRMLPRARRPAGGRGQQRSEQLDRGRPARHGVLDVDREVPDPDRPLRQVACSADHDVSPERGRRSLT